MLLSMSRRQRMARRALQSRTRRAEGLHPGATGRDHGPDRRLAGRRGTADTGDPERDLATLLVEVGQVGRAGAHRRGLLSGRDAEPRQGGARGGLHGHEPSGTALASGRTRRRRPAAVRRDSCERRGPTPSACSPTASSTACSSTPRPARRSSPRPSSSEVTYEPNAVELIVEASARTIPHFLQEYGRVLWNEVEPSPIRARDVIARRH